MAEDTSISSKVVGKERQIGKEPWIGKERRSLLETKIGACWKGMLALIQLVASRSSGSFEKKWQVPLISSLLGSETNVGACWRQKSELVGKECRRSSSLSLHVAVAVSRRSGRSHGRSH